MPHSLVTDCAKYLIVLPIIVSGIFWLLRLNQAQKIQYVLLFVLGGLFTLLIAKTAAHIYFDARPFIRDGVVPYFKSSTDNGFPSDHTLLAALFAATMWPYSRKLSVLLYGVAIVVGGSRVISGVHHGVDIIGALVISTVAVILAWLAIRQVSSKMHYTKSKGE